MQKTAICAAAAAMLTLLAAGAQAQSNVTIYGVADVFLEYGKAGTKSAPTTVVREQSGGINSSRLGFKGTEDLGGGLKANFVFEHGLLLDTGTQANAAFWNRQSYVGLSGDWGSLTGGRQYSPLLVQQDGFDPAPGTTLYGSAYNSGVLRTVSRVNNSVLYTSPAFGGFSGSAMVGLGEATGGFHYNRVASGSVKYAGGPFGVGLAFLHQTKPDASKESKAIWNLSGSYQVGDLQLLGALQTTRNDSQNANTLDDRREFLIGAVYTLGNGQIRTSWGQAKVKDVSDTTARHLSAGYIHNLSKRTAVYTVAQAIKNPDNLAYRSSGYSFDAVDSGPAVGAGVTARAFAVGIRHRF